MLLDKEVSLVEVEGVCFSKISSIQFLSLIALIFVLII